MAPKAHAASSFHSLALLTLVASGCLIGIITFGPRATLGLFLVPMTEAKGWSRETFAFSLALQNLFWGIGQPIAGFIADRFGTARILSAGALLYAAGLALMATTDNPFVLQITAGVLMGLGIAGCAFFLVMAAFARLLPESARSLGFGLATASGSIGQFLFAPLSLALLETSGYQTALFVMASCLLVVPLLTLPLRGRPRPASPTKKKTEPVAQNQSVRAALAEAFGHRSYQLLIAGFFVCGFHVAFITVHLVPFLADRGIVAAWGAVAISLIGLFNIVGSIASGFLGGRYSKRWLLSGIYFLRAIVIVIFLMMPATPLTVCVFASAMGVLWLSTVPPTQGLVVVMFGTRYVAMLFGFVFLSHQIGSFLGVWLGGFVYDRTGTYDLVWYLGILLGLLAAIVHVPIKEQAVTRPLAQPT